MTKLAQATCCMAMATFSPMQVDVMSDDGNASSTPRVRSMDRRVQSALGRQLAAVFDDTTHAEMPGEISGLLDQLEERGEGRDA